MSSGNALAVIDEQFNEQYFQGLVIDFILWKYIFGGSCYVQVVIIKFNGCF